MDNNNRKLTENQIRGKIYADVAIKLNPPFSFAYIAEEILGVSKQRLNGYLKKYHPEFEKRK